tara:strand:- start:100 stop:351 length:252 start_codon:yes stop_codon:yes gene_type:complete
MKKLIAVCFAALLVMNSANAGLISAFRSSDWPTKQTEKYKLNVQNFDVRVYEWTPSHNKNVSCVFVAGNKNATGVACYLKEGE